MRSLRAGSLFLRAAGSLLSMFRLPPGGVFGVPGRVCEAAAKRFGLRALLPRKPVEIPDDRVWSADTLAAHAAPLRGRGRRCQAHSGTMFDVKPGASADGSSSPGPTPACRIVVDHHGGFVPAVPSLYKDEGAERLQSPNAATGKPLKKNTCTAAGTLLEIPLTPRGSCAAPPQPISGQAVVPQGSLRRSFRAVGGQAV